MTDRVLLIVDDCPEIGRGLRRCLKRGFDTVHVATNASEAESLLDDSRRCPIYVLCDHYLGENSPGGVDLVGSWRRRFPNIVSAAVFSGSDLHDIPAAGGIDRIFRKPLDVDAIETFFTPKAPSAEASEAS